MKRILAVEDEPDIQELLLTYLRDAGYDAVTASDGGKQWQCSAKGTSN